MDIDKIKNELGEISKDEIRSPMSKFLDEFFFSDKDFLTKFFKCTGSGGTHHAYEGGLAEHTLNVMYLTKTFAYRYECKYKEIAIVAAKIHDIGKIKQYFSDGTTKSTLTGKMEGHVILGSIMLEECFTAAGSILTEDYKNRVRGCLVQHHGKVEFGSPVPPNTEEAFIVHYADYVDCTINKVQDIANNTMPNTWSNYDDRIKGKIYV